MPRLGMQRKPLSRTALRKLGVETDHDVTMVQTGGQAETVMVMATGKCTRLRSLRWKLAVRIDSIDTKLLQ